MFSNQLIHFELHPHIPETHTKMLVYEKGVLIKHIKASAIVKVEFTVLRKKGFEDVE